MARVDPDLQYGERVSSAIGGHQWERVSAEISRFYMTVSEPMRNLGAWAQWSGSTFTIPNSTLTVVNMNTFHYDNGGYYRGTGFAVIPPGLAGLYVVSTGVRYDSDAAPTVNYIGVQHNGTMLFRQAVPAGAFNSAVGTFSTYCRVGDTLQMVMFQSSGGAITLDPVLPTGSEAASPQMRLHLTS